MGISQKNLETCHKLSLTDEIYVLMFSYNKLSFLNVTLRRQKHSPVSELQVAIVCADFEDSHSVKCSFCGEFVEPIFMLKTNADLKLWMPSKLLFRSGITLVSVTSTDVRSQRRNGLSQSCARVAV